MTSTGPEHDLACWIRLTRTPGVGNQTGRRLLAAFGLPANVFAADLYALRNVVSEPLARALLAPPSEDTRRLVERTLHWLEQDGNRVLTLADGDYPQTLLQIPDPPLMLHVKGRIELLSRRMLAVVGSRNATAQGIEHAERFSETLSGAGLTIVSGMALGIDAAAHRGGLRGPGSTVAVVGTGADIIYPQRNRSLALQLAGQGCIVSEYGLGVEALPANFPRRNRIISGLACGVLVIEAAARSGSLITARVAAEQGREVFAIPGSIHSPLSKGCHHLIRQGAKLVESAQDVLEEFVHNAPLESTTPHPQPTAASHEPAPPLLVAIGHDPVSPDVLAMRCELDISMVNAQLLALELEGRIEMLAGGMVRRLDLG